MCISIRKKGRSSIIWQRCIICQVNTAESLTIPAEQRKDEVYRRLVSEFTSIQNAPFQNFKNHKTCYRSFTSKQNLSAISLILGEPLFESQENPDANDNQVKTIPEI